MFLVMVPIPSWYRYLIFFLKLVRVQRHPTQGIVVPTLVHHRPL